MLKNDQIEKLETAEMLLLEVMKSQEFQELDINPDLTLGDSLQGIQEVLQEFYPDDYVPMSPETEEIRQIQIVRVRLKRSESWSSKLIDMLSKVAFVSLLTAAVSAGISIFFYGISDIDKSVGNKLKPDFAAVSLGYKGLSIAGFGLFLTAGVSASIIASGEKN